jgi:hypothetical protein
LVWGGMMGRGRSGPIRAVYATVQAVGDDPYVEIVLLDMPPTGSVLTLDPDDYEPAVEPDHEAADAEPLHPGQPDPAAATHEKRRLLYPSLDMALRLVIGPRGPVTRATITPVGNALVLRLTLLEGLKAATLGTREWVHALRLINSWLSNAQRRPGTMLGMPLVEREADAIASIYDKREARNAAIARVLGTHVVEALNGVLGVYRD